VKDGTTVSGYPHMEQHKFRRSYAALRNLPEMMNELNALKREVEELKKLKTEK
jgi:UDP-3-O-[3-hydroxymyristoyl] glucosamine N-acyltransferase